MAALLFHREFLGYTGGHGKVFDYFRHTASHGGWIPRVFFSAGVDHPENPWLMDAEPSETCWAPEFANALFFAGTDWRQWPSDRADRPVINLLQHVRHGDPSSDVHPFLERRAVRICVSQSVADAVMDSGRVRGPVRVIDAALDLPVVAHGQRQRGSAIVVAALKQPSLGRELASSLRAQGHEVLLLDAPLPRTRYLEAIAASRVAICLPNKTEGFYLPALEAMALGCAVIVPDCVGNRAYVEPGINALSAGWNLESIVAAVECLNDEALKASLVQRGSVTAQRFTQVRERDAFHRLLNELPELWRESACA